MDQQTVTLIAAVVAAVVTLASLLLNSRFTLERERQLVIWRKEVDRMFEIEELAGKLVEETGSYKGFEVVRDRIVPLLDQFDTMCGRLARHPKVRQSARDLHMALSKLLYDMREHQDDRQSRADLEPAHRTLLFACDEVLGRRTI